MQANVLIVADDAVLRRALVDRLASRGHATAEARTGEEALALVAAHPPDLVLLDFSTPNPGGTRLLERWREDGLAADVVVLVPPGPLEPAVKAIRLGAAGFLPTPVDFDLLEWIVKRSLERRRMVRVNRALAGRGSGGPAPVAGQSAAMRELFETAARAAVSAAPVLISGESGVGKQVLAEFIHGEGPRRDGPFVHLDCVAPSDELVESSLFGHEQGAFDGAVATREGGLEAAAGGTAFLDEIGGITLRLQTRLLRFLETGRFERVGGNRALHVDCRVVAATRRDLAAEALAGDFRADLYYRLNGIHLHVPPLRERPADILPLAGAFAAHFAAELKRPAPALAVRTRETLCAYAWPGNVRQLRNAMERMVVLARTATLTPDLLPPEILAPGQEGALDPSGLPLHEAETEFRRRYIARALARTGGNQTEAARHLGLQRTFLNRLIRELGLGARSREREPVARGGAED